MVIISCNNKYFGEMQLNDIFKQGHNFTFSRLEGIEFDNYTIFFGKKHLLPIRRHDWRIHSKLRQFGI